MTFRKITHLKQGTSKWRNWRKGVIGASDAPTIMGENPWKNIESLFNEKVGLEPEFKGNANTREGKRLEPIARKFLSSTHELKLQPTIIQDSKHPFLIASLDGIDEDHQYIFEIKCGRYAYRHTREIRNVPLFYKAQLQHMLMITNFEYLYYCSYWPGENAIQYKIHRDDNYIKILRKTELEFAERLTDYGHKLEEKFLGRKIK